MRRDITEKIKIEGSNYELKESHIISWLHNYGVVESSLEEEAVVLGEESEAVQVSTGTYLVQVCLKRHIPNIVPMQGIKIRIWYSGVKIQCGICHGYHKKEKNFLHEKSFDVYTSGFKENKPQMPKHI